MGNKGLLKLLSDKIYGIKEARIMILGETRIYIYTQLVIIRVCIYMYIYTGLDAAGKTSILYQLKLGEIVTTIPTIGE